MSAAINELYEPGSPADRVDAWDFLKDLAARSTAMGPISSRLVDSKRLGKLDRQYLEAAVLSMSGEEGWSSVAVATDRNSKYFVTGLSARRPEVPPQHVCSSPGCNLPDYHDGPCSHEMRAGRRKVTPSTAFSAKLNAAIAKLESGVVAMGKWEGHFAEAVEGITWMSIAELVGEMGLKQWTRLLDEAMRPDGCAIIIVSGACIPRELHTPVIHLFAERLAGSSLIALNLGEFTDADAESYDALATATARPQCVLGHVYFQDPVTPDEKERKSRMRALLRQNSFKSGYLQQLARHEVQSLGGANCWHNFTDVLRRRAWAAANDALLFHELRRRWTNGVIRFNIESGHAHSVLSYLQNKRNYNERGFLRLGTLAVGGFNNEYRSQASRFDEALQWRHSRHFSNEALQSARREIPGFTELLDGARASLPETHHGGHTIVATHANALDQGSTHTRLREHDDLDEELQAVDEIDGEAVRDRKIKYTVIISLSGGTTSLQVLGKHGGEVFFEQHAGAGLVFLSALTHATGESGKGIWKLTIFFGYFLKIDIPKRRRDGT